LLVLRHSKQGRRQKNFQGEPNEIKDRKIPKKTPKNSKPLPGGEATEKKTEK